ncbi:GGDEF domain-containing protein [Clostridium vincentii]|uniref:Cyclic di-GMP phosphodiesterase YfgF n=1 Tax=Clostridium vincentii TaxID=52704 RepID=A0A2T0BJJ4_9CLOT|nr:GGDEF domain-containing protein [Clostridium vincentii]PRR84068.1 Cyclic di-GMP phosphodiesterase YfgF [Clostridium vincentii]
MENTLFEKQYMDYRFEEFSNVLKTGSIKSVFQPIVSLKDSSILGYEALSRGPEDSHMQNPEVLLEMAKEYDKLWELELLFRSKSIETLYKHKVNAKLFLNINPSILDSMKFKDSFTDEYLEKYDLCCEDVIFEITERTKIKDIDSFKKTLDYCKNKNYKIAIDDAGSGYSGLNRICNIKPDYIKLDIELVRDIDKDSTKMALVKSMCEFSKLVGSFLIAEGIETEKELKVLIELGVDFGQGYFIQRPKPHIIPIKNDVVELIKNLNIKEKNQYGHNISDICISTISKKIQTLRPDVLVSDVDSIFKENANLFGICIVEDERVLGVVTRNSFYSKLGWQFGYSLYSSKPISLIMQEDYLNVDCDMPIDMVIKVAMSRSKESLYDHVTVLKNSKYYGIVTIKDLIEKTIEIKVNNARHSNPLTGLPGNIVIEQNIEKAICSNENYCVLYFDIDNFKAYNDAYGFENGDVIIKALSKAISSNLRSKEFIGHIGGDDFIAILPHWEVDNSCDNIIKDFESLAHECYDEKDLKNGYITSHNRHGVVERFPLVSVSIAGVTNRNKEYQNVYEVAKESSCIKKECKQKNGSCYSIN